MGLFGWLKKRSGGGNQDLAHWHIDWRAAAAAGGTEEGIAALAARLDALALSPDDKEIELEMLGALEDLVALRRSVEQGGLPVIETGHRVVGTDRCHFIAPVSMPDDEAQPSGRLLLTGVKAIFVGGSRTTTVAWHAVGEAVYAERDLVLIRKDRQHLYRFRCNSFADALCGAFLSGRLAAARQGGGNGPARN